MDSVANYTINYLENNQSKIKQNPDDKIRKTNIILHGENSISNAFVTSSPRRSEFYANAKPESSHFLHNNNWIDLLVNHEYRHLVQRELHYILHRYQYEQVKATLIECHLYFDVLIAQK